MSQSDRRPLLVGLVVLLVLGAFVALRFEITTDLYAFLPEADDRELGTLSRRIAQSELSRTMVLAVEAANEAEAVEVSRVFERALRAEPAVTRELDFLEAGPPEGVDRALFELYAPRRFAFLARTSEEARAALSDEGLRRSAGALREELGGPMSPLVSRLAPRDPLLVLPALFKDMESSVANELAVVEGRFLAKDGRTAIFFLGTRASAFDAEAQAPLLEGIERAFDVTNARFSSRLRLDQSGVNRFATRAAGAIRDDIERVSSLSVVIIGLMLFGLFRSFRLVGLTSIPIGAGVLAGSALVLLLFGRLHGVTLAFGSSLIGVSIDYVVHVYCFSALHQGSTTGGRIFPSLGRTLATGAATTIAGFLALVPSSLVGLREVACFSVAGMLAAYLATRFMLPSLIPATFPPVALRSRIVVWLERLIARLRARRALLFVFPLGAALFIALVLPHARWNDDFASLNRLDPGLLAEDARVRDKVMRFEQMRFVVALGADDEAALSVSEQVHRALLEAEAADELEAHRSISRMLPSAATQRAVAEVAYADPTLAARFDRAFVEAGFTLEGFEPFREALREARLEPLTSAALLGSPLAPMARAFRVELDDRVGYVTFLHGLHEPDALARRLEGVEGAVFLRQSDLFGQAHRTYQERTLRQLGFGLLAVFAMLFYRYRDLRRTLAIVVPSLLAVGVTASVLTLTGRGLDLVTLTALLFVVSMGDDYGVFLVDALDEEDESGLHAALLGIAIACVTTLVGFGLLAFSEHPVLAGLGITAASGIAASVVLSPTTMLFLTRDTKTKADLT